MLNGKTLHNLEIYLDNLREKVAPMNRKTDWKNSFRARKLFGSFEKRSLDSHFELESNSLHKCCSTCVFICLWVTGVSPFRFVAKLLWRSCDTQWYPGVTVLRSLWLNSWQHTLSEYSRKTVTPVSHSCFAKQIVRELKQRRKQRQRMRHSHCNSYYYSI